MTKELENPTLFLSHSFYLEKLATLLSILAILLSCQAVNGLSIDIHRTIEII